MNLFTIILDYSGGTYIQQVKSDSPKQAAIEWAKGLDAKTIHGIGASSKKAIIDILLHPDEEPVVINEAINVWCSSFVVRNRLGLIHIVKTSE